MQNKIIEISVDKLKKHPKNPRKEIGDIRELIASIKEKGILQNLTVIPNNDDDDTYTIIIGHRRFAAAKSAGIKTLPCSVVELSEKEQVAVMLLENIQRVDLNIQEEAQGYQMLMDMGDSVSEIYKKTGISKTKIKNRLKLLNLNQELLKESLNKNVNFDDYMELTKIEKEEERDKILSLAGTPNFKWKLLEALENQEREKAKIKVLEDLKEYAIPYKEFPKAFISSYINYTTYTKYKRPKDFNEKQYYYDLSFSGVHLYELGGKRENLKYESKETEKQKQKNEAREKLRELEDQMTNARIEFIKNISNKKCEEIKSEILKGFTNLAVGDWLRIEESDLEEFFGIDDYTDGEIIKNLEKMYENEPYKAVLVMIDSQVIEGTIPSYNYNIKQVKQLNNLYYLLEKLGYEISSEEKSLLDGTHELFEKLK